MAFPVGDGRAGSTHYPSFSSDVIPFVKRVIHAVAHNKVGNSIWLQPLRRPAFALKIDTTHLPTSKNDPRNMDTEDVNSQLVRGKSFRPRPRSEPKHRYLVC